MLPVCVYVCALSYHYYTDSEGEAQRMELISPDYKAKAGSVYFYP